MIQVLQATAQTIATEAISLESVNRIGLILLITAAAHFTVVIIKKVSRHLSRLLSAKSFARTMSVTSLLTSILVFTIYFLCVGFILKELGVSLTAYLASASVIGLALGFGSQGVVQDVVTGFTLVISDLIDIDDMVEMNGQTGIIKHIGMRFVILENALGAAVFIPNRNITNVINYPDKYIRCMVDIVLPQHQAGAPETERVIKKFIQTVEEQFPNIIAADVSVENVLKTIAGKTFRRITFPIWPGRGGPLETTCRQELLQQLKSLDPDYADWMITVNYEIEKRVRAF